MNVTNHLSITNHVTMNDQMLAQDSDAEIYETAIQTLVPQCEIFRNTEENFIVKCISVRTIY